MYFDIVIPFIYRLNPVFFWVSIPSVILIEALILWQFRIGSLSLSILYSFTANIFSVLLGVLILLLVFPFDTTASTWGALVSSVLIFPFLMILIWLVMFVLSIAVEYMVLRRFRLSNGHILSAVVVSNIVSYLMLIIPYWLFLIRESP